MTLDTRIRLEGIAAFLAGLAACAFAVGPYVTHIVWCIRETADGLLIVGLILVPVGWVHGVCLWMGWSWI